MPASWRIQPPKADARDPLVVGLGKPLDHALLSRALGVQTMDQRPPGGDVTLDAHDTRWLFRPATRWRSGEYDLVALPILEDPSGNRMGRPFETDLRGPNVEPASDDCRVPFSIPGAPAGAPR